jgi:hypothetical protein
MRWWDLKTNNSQRTPNELLIGLMLKDIDINTNF